MKRVLIFITILFSLNSFGQFRDSVINYSLSDSVKAISFMTEFTVRDITKKKYAAVGIMTDAVTLSLQKFPIGASINFHAINNYMQKPVAKGLNVKNPDLKTESLSFSYDWKVGDTYRLLIAQATDSAGNFSLYSGYVFLPKENKWKLIGTFKIDGRWNSLQRPTVFYGGRKKQTISAAIEQVWIQRTNGSWKNMLQADFKPPVVNLFSHVDSLEQLAIEKKTLEKLQSPNSPIKFTESGGVYFAIMKEGTGRQVSVNDTVVVHYKGYLFDDNSVFDQTKDKPATFPLKRLIMGWQIALQFCKVGGKVQVIIPSNLAYSIRTRAAKIPPNSILVFEIEVVDAKAPQ